MGLVDYSSDSDEPRDEDQAPDFRDAMRTGPEGPRKRRKVLPSLPTSFDPSANVDDPSLHQGRNRSRPFVAGEYNAHVYISLELGKAFDEVLQEISQLAQSLCPDHLIHSLLRSPIPANGSKPERSRKLPLHISLTHPLPLRRDQIRTFKSNLAARGAAHSGSDGRGLKMSFAGQVTAYVNGRRHGGEGSGGRAFLAIRVAAGAKQLEAMVERAIHPVLDNLHLPRYHSNPEFHASFAWCLLHPTGESGPRSADLDLDVLEDDAPDSKNAPASPFDASLLKKLNARFGDQLMRTQHAAGWEVTHMELKIAKDIYRIPL